MKEKFSVSGMFCAACQANVERSVKKLKGVDSVIVSLINNTMIVCYDENITNSTNIIECVKKAGYSACFFDSKNKLVKEKDVKIRKIKLIISMCFMFLLLYVSMGQMLKVPVPFQNNKICNVILQMVLLTPICILNFFFFKDGYNKLFKLKPNMSSLIAVASSSSIVYGIYAFIVLLVKSECLDFYFESAGTILTLVSLGKYIEFKSKGKTTKAVDELINLVPEKALKVVDGEIVEIYLEEICKGDTLLIKNGMEVAVDGIIIEGSAEIDESMITGESKLIYKEKGEKVISSTLCINGSFKMTATSTSNDSTIAKIISIVDEASNSKAKISRIADNVSLVFVPCVFLISIITLIVWLFVSHDFEMSFRNAISVLVISCPCALGLATPLAIMLATGISAKKSILFKNAESLENLHKIDTIYLDKTGTITTGNLKVVKINSYELEQVELIKVAASLETLSTHPIAKSILDYYKDKELYEVSDFNTYLGKGIGGIINGTKYYIGNKKLVLDNNISFEYNEDSNTCFYIFTNKLLGVIELSDEIKESTYQAIAYFKQNNIDVTMVTGDNELVSDKVSKSLGIKYIANVSPIEKGEIVKEAVNSGKKIAFVGDGINDAIALTNSYIGIAIGAGTDVAISSASIVLMKNDLMDVVNALNISKKTINNIKLSLFWAFFYNVLCIPIACGALAFVNILLNPMIGSLAMSFSSVSVVLNSLRLNKLNK